jgi:5-methyltetrahydrofolate--homocysteine methyltransferase
VPSVFRNAPPADAEDEALRTAPEDWRAQTAEQKAAINQFHTARIAEHFRQTGARDRCDPRSPERQMDKCVIEDA